MKYISCFELKIYSYFIWNELFYFSIYTNLSYIISTKCLKSLILLISTIKNIYQNLLNKVKNIVYIIDLKS